MAQLDGAGNVTQQYVYATRLNVPDLVLTSAGATLRVLTDQVGSVRRVVDTATGATVLEREYSPYGALEFENGSFEQPFGYAGGLEDSLTGLVRFGARDYDPGVGRWTAKDPILTDGGVNLYEYGASAPQMFVDPTGRNPLWFLYLALGLFVSSDNGGEENGNMGGFLGVASLPAQGALLKGGLKAAGVGCSRLTQLVARLFGPKLVGPYGKVAVSVVEAAASGGGHTTAVVTNLTQAPVAGRALSVAIGDGAGALAGAARASGHFFTAQIPTRLIVVLENVGLVQRSITSMGGVVATELRFHPAVSEYIVSFF